MVMPCNNTGYCVLPDTKLMSSITNNKSEKKISWMGLTLDWKSKKKEKEKRNGPGGAEAQ